MGWSWTVTCRSKKAQEQMLAFLEEHYIPSSRVLPWPEDHWRYQHPKLPSEHTKYAGTKTSIGFDSPTDHEQAVLRWLALRVGKKRTWKTKLGPDFPAVPWVNMDDQDMLPVITKDQWDGNERTEQYTVDEHGWRPVSRFGIEQPSILGKMVAYILELRKEADEKDRLIRADILRLDELWKNHVAA
jgi:hypothetical protein